MFSHPTLIDWKVDGIWLGSRMFVQYIICRCIALMTRTATLIDDVVAIQTPSVNLVHKNLNVFPFK